MIIDIGLTGGRRWLRGAGSCARFLPSHGCAAVGGGGRRDPRARMIGSDRARGPRRGAGVDQPGLAPTTSSVPLQDFRLTPWAVGTHTCAGVSSAAAAGSAGATAAGSSAAGSAGAAASGVGLVTGSSGPGSPAAAMPSCGNFDGDGALDGEPGASAKVLPPTVSQSSSPTFEEIAGSTGAESDVLSGLPPVVAPARFPPSVGSVEVLLTRVGC